MQNSVRDLTLPLSLLRRVFTPPSLGAGFASLLGIAGLTAIWSTVVMLMALWTTDALKSIGMVIPVVSFLLVLRVWRSLGWELDGTWWGFALLCGLFALVRIRDHAVLLLVLSPQWTLFFPPHSVVAFAYGAGLVLLFGGVRLFRASLFPLLLLLFVDPVPHVFNVFVDLPLQRASAHVARAFAMALGQPLSPDKLRLMFTPEFGMFIAPGCNGIRGAVTMGLIALVAGYLYRFRGRAHTLVVLGAIALGYVFNFVRLCVLVLFYLLALHVPSLQDRAENADYLIGAGLFFAAVYLLYVVIQRLGGEQAGGVLHLPVREAEATSVPRSFYLRAAAMTLLVVAGAAGVVRGFRPADVSAAVQAEDTAPGDFPQTAGHYTLVRTWNEDLMTGTLLFHWAEYAPTGGGTHLEIGISPVLGAHDTMVCHSARGEDPIWHGPLVFKTAGGDDVTFNTALYNTGATQSLEATTICDGSGCGEYASNGLHLGFVYSRMNPRAMMGQGSTRSMPVLLKAETIDTTLKVDAARAQLGAAMADFLQGVAVNGLTMAYRKE